MQTAIATDHSAGRTAWATDDGRECLSVTRARALLAIQWADRRSLSFSPSWRVDERINVAPLGKLLDDVRYPACIIVVYRGQLVKIRHTANAAAGAPEARLGDTLISRPHQQMTTIHHACVLHNAIGSAPRMISGGKCVNKSRLRPVSHWQYLFTPKGVYFPGVCLSICLSVSSTTQKVVDEFWWKFFAGVRCVTSKKWLDFAGDPDHVILGLGQWLKWGGQGAQSPAPIWDPCNSVSPPDWIYKVLFYAQITPH